MKEIVKVLLQEGIDVDTIHEILDIIEEKYETIKESSHKRKYGEGSNPENSTIEAIGTKYFKDGIAMDPKAHSVSNGTNGVYFNPRSTYNSRKDKQVLQNNIKAGKNVISDTKEFKKIQKDLIDSETKNDMYGNSLKDVAHKLANRGSSTGRKSRNSFDRKYGLRNGENDGTLSKDSPEIQRRIEGTKKRLSVKESYNAINELEDSTKVSCGKKRVDNYANEVKKYEELNSKYPKDSTSVPDKAASLMAIAKQAKKVDKAEAKLQKYGKLAGKGIKDPVQRKEFVDYASKNMPG